MNLTTIIVSWNRPSLFARTLEAVRKNSSGGVLVVDNGSDSETKSIILASTAKHEHLLLPSNVGINRAVELVIDKLATKYVHVSDADIQYIEHFKTAVDMLESGAMCVSYLDSPEHNVIGERESLGRKWLLKSCERGASLFMATNYLKSLCPLPRTVVDFDWWVCQNSPLALMRMGQPVWVLPRAAWHLGWRQGHSTHNQGHEHPEYYYVSR